MTRNPNPSRTLPFKQVLPEAVVADRQPGARPRSAPLDALFDVDRLLAWWASVDAVLHRVRRGRF